MVYVIEPSGATGFGQEFSAHHVNTGGEGVAQDIIEGTNQFCKEHAFVNDKKIGCIGAVSYTHLAWVRYNCLSAFLC